MAMGGCRILWPVAGYLAMYRVACTGTWLKAELGTALQGLICATLVVNVRLPIEQCYYWRGMATSRKEHQQPFHANN
jgi:hypothetical protein